VFDLTGRAAARLVGASAGGESPRRVT
jgi:hypothetical protein